jgi:hypothetical protein
MSKAFQSGWLVVKGGVKKYIHDLALEMKEYMRDSVRPDSPGASLEEAAMLTAQYEFLPRQNWDPESKKYVDHVPQGTPEQLAQQLIDFYNEYGGNY